MTDRIREAMAQQTGDSGSLNWQPIETAPKDGTRIIGWFPTYGRGVAWQTHWYHQPRHPDGGWWWYWRVSGEVPPQPTHWTPFEPPN